jgi:hypothetical protein
MIFAYRNMLFSLTTSKLDELPIAFVWAVKGGLDWPRSLVKIATIEINEFSYRK